MAARGDADAARLLVQAMADVDTVAMQEDIVAAKASCVCAVPRRAVARRQARRDVQRAQCSEKQRGGVVGMLSSSEATGRFGASFPTDG